MLYVGSYSLAGSAVIVIVLHYVCI